MKINYKIILCTIAFVLIARSLMDIAIAAIDINYHDIQIQSILMREEININKNMPVNIKRLNEKMELISLIHNYINLRKANPFVSGYIGFGSDEVLIVVTKYMMYEALGYELEKSPIVLIAE